MSGIIIGKEKNILGKKNSSISVGQTFSLVIKWLRSWSQIMIVKLKFLEDSKQTFGQDFNVKIMQIW